MTAAKLLVEFTGTFFLVLVIGMTALDPELPAGLGPIAVAAVLTAMIFATGHITGAHFNPIVTIAFTMRGRTPRSDTGPFIVAQLVAAVAAGLLVLWAAGAAATAGETPPVEPLALDLVPTVVFETLFTFALVFVILNVALSRGIEGNQFYGLAVGAVVLAGAYVAGPVSGAAFNPAVTVALGTMGLADWSDVWMPLTSQVAGGAMAVAAFAFIDSGSGGR